jgi:SAM-dependent methyltransferase
VEQSPSDLAGHPDRVRWNARYRAASAPSFTAHPLAVAALALDLPDGPVADLACGTSGGVLLAAAQGRPVTGVDVSEVALGLLAQEARRRRLDHLISLVHADLRVWRPGRGRYALILATGFWDPGVFAAAVPGLAPGGVLGWEAFTTAAREARPLLPADWCLGPGEPATLLPDDVTVLSQEDIPGTGHGARRRLLARRLTTQDK